MSTMKRVASAAATVAFCYPSLGQANNNDNNGFFVEFNASNTLSEYILRIPRTALSDTNSFSQYLPETMNFGITTSGCAQIEAGYGWSGGNTYVGGFSWEGATTLYGERCNATISLPMNGIVETALKQYQN